MPNWCSNRMTVRGDVEAITDFHNRVFGLDDEGKENYDILGRLYPIPTELKETVAGSFTPEGNTNWKIRLENGTMTQQEYDDAVAQNAEGYAKNQANLAKYGVRDWYDWCLSHWGTKWGDCHTVLNEGSDTHLDFLFDSAWSPPIDGLNHISTMFPTLVFILQYEELGMGFVGASRIQNGNVSVSDANVDDIDTSGVDFDDAEFDWSDWYEKIGNLKSECVTEVMGMTGEPLSHPQMAIVAEMEAIRNVVLKEQSE